MRSRRAGASDVAEVTRSVTRTGFGDLRLRFTLGLLGSPALSPREFVRRTPGPALGASLVVAPTGEYFPDKLINIGSWVSGLLGKAPTASVTRAGGFPRPVPSNAT